MPKSSIMQSSLSTAATANTRWQFRELYCQTSCTPRIPYIGTCAIEETYLKTSKRPLIKDTHSENVVLSHLVIRGISFDVCAFMGGRAHIKETGNRNATAIFENCYQPELNTCYWMEQRKLRKRQRNMRGDWQNQFAGNEASHSCIAAWFPWMRCFVTRLSE
jgi:cytochrome b involved in lipid metabolism